MIYEKLQKVTAPARAAVKCDGHSNRHFNNGTKMKIKTWTIVYNDSNDKNPPRHFVRISDQLSRKERKKNYENKQIAHLLARIVHHSLQSRVRFVITRGRPFFRWPRIIVPTKLDILRSSSRLSVEHGSMIEKVGIEKDWVHPAPNALWWAYIICTQQTGSADSTDMAKRSGCKNGPPRAVPLSLLLFVLHSPHFFSRLCRHIYAAVV